MNIQSITDKALVKHIAAHQSYIDERSRRVKRYKKQSVPLIEISSRLNIALRTVSHVLTGK